MARPHSYDRGDEIVATTASVDAMSRQGIEYVHDLMYGSLERDLERLADHVAAARCGDHLEADDAHATANNLRCTFAMLDQLGWVA